MIAAANASVFKESSAKMVEVYDPAPDFSAIASDGRRVTLFEFKGKQAVVLFFYPADNSPICTLEACSFRDSYEEFVKSGTTVIGVSSDSDESHRSFSAEHRLPFILIADNEGRLRRLFDVHNFMYVLPRRVTFVIDRNGIVRLKFTSQLFGSAHVEEAIKTIRQLNRESM